MGLYNTFTTHTLEETATGYYVMADSGCPPDRACHCSRSGSGEQCFRLARGRGPADQVKPPPRATTPSAPASPGTDSAAATRRRPSRPSRPDPDASPPSPTAVREYTVKNHGDSDPPCAAYRAPVAGNSGPGSN